MTRKQTAAEFREQVSLVREGALRWLKDEKMATTKKTLSDDDQAYAEAEKALPLGSGVQRSGKGRCQDRASASNHSLARRILRVCPAPGAWTM